jgi:hypothetical protein
MSNTTPRKLAVVRKPAEPLCLEQGEAVHVGADVHEDALAVWDEVEDELQAGGPPGPTRRGTRATTTS